MNSIIMNFDDSIDINMIYNQLRKQYPKIEIIKKNNSFIHAMKEMQETMASQIENLGFQNEEDAIKWIYEVRNEIRKDYRSENST